MTQNNSKHFLKAACSLCNECRNYSLRASIFKALKQSKKEAWYIAPFSQVTSSCDQWLRIQHEAAVGPVSRCQAGVESILCVRTRRECCRRWRGRAVGGCGVRSDCVRACGPVHQFQDVYVSLSATGVLHAVRATCWLAVTPRFLTRRRRRAPLLGDDSATLTEYQPKIAKI